MCTCESKGLTELLCSLEPRFLHRRANHAFVERRAVRDATVSLNGRGRGVLSRPSAPRVWREEGQHPVIRLDLLLGLSGSVRIQDTLVPWSPVVPGPCLHSHIFWEVHVSR